jgi:hypothetical protein
MNLLFEDVGTPVVLLKDDKGQTEDECIAVPLGGTEGYLKAAEALRGVFYIPRPGRTTGAAINKMESPAGRNGQP